MAAPKVCRFFETLDKDGAYVSETAMVALAAQAEMYGVHRLIPPLPIISSLLELVAIQRYFADSTPPGYEAKREETWDGQLNGKARSAIEDGNRTELLNAVNEFATEWRFMYRLEQSGYSISEMKTTQGIECVIDGGYTVEVLRKRLDPSASSLQFVDEQPRVSVDPAVRNLPAALQAAWSMAEFRIDEKLDRADEPLDIVAVDITNRTPGLELMAIAELSPTDHLTLAKQVPHAKRIADKGDPAILFYAWPGVSKLCYAIALPYGSMFHGYGALGVPSVRFRPLRQSEITGPI